MCIRDRGVDEPSGGVRPQGLAEQRPVGQRELQVPGEQAGVERLAVGVHPPGDDPEGLHAWQPEPFKHPQHRVLPSADLGVDLLDRHDPVAEPNEAHDVPGDAPGAVSYTHLDVYKRQILACPVNGSIDCGKVTTSAWSKLFGIPVSYLGLLFFIGMIALCTTAAWTRGSALVHNLRLGGTVVGVAMVLYLVWAELFRIGAICLWCTVVHVVSFALFCVVLFARVLAEPTPAATLRR